MCVNASTNIHSNTSKSTISSLHHHSCVREVQEWEGDLLLLSVTVFSLLSPSRSPMVVCDTLLGSLVAVAPWLP